MKEGIDNYDCRIVGFIDLGEVNNVLQAFEQSTNSAAAPLANHILLIMFTMHLDITIM